MSRRQPLQLAAAQTPNEALVIVSIFMPSHDLGRQRWMCHRPCTTRVIVMFDIVEMSKSLYDEVVNHMSEQERCMLLTDRKDNGLELRIIYDC